MIIPNQGQRVFYAEKAFFRPLSEKSRHATVSEKNNFYCPIYRDGLVEFFRLISAKIFCPEVARHASRAVLDT